VIRFDFDERHVFEPPDDQLPWFVRVLIADATFWALFLFIAGPWLALIYLLWPRVPEKPHQVAEERTPIVFMQPQEIPRELLRPRIASPKPTPKPTENITVPGNTKPFEAGEPPAPKPAPPDPPAAELPRPEPETQITRNTTTPPPVPQPGRDEAPRAPATGVLGRALQNLDRYAREQTPANPPLADRSPEQSCFGHGKFQTRRPCGAWSRRRTAMASAAMQRLRTFTKPPLPIRTSRRL